ncbi:beta-ketoacyl synthase N-terminal-like domain-containing protein [Pseudocolwellia sp. HL-MZ7]|uniref:beta-ketoacyl synthase N-terminal-like domain-containing protein n=1 Tax=Pseudocolwellia sp. HL-MZ7 TaxID=3400627 RepID=UPI003CF2748B
MNSVFVIATSSISAIGDQQECQQIDDSQANLVDVTIAAENKSALYFPINKNKLDKSFDEMILLLSTQIEKALKQSNLTAKELSETVLFLGSTSLDISCVKPDSSESIWLSQTDKLSQTLTKLFGLHTIHYTFNTACTSSANALLYAAQLIKHNKIKHAIVIGCEFYNQLSVSGFDSLDLFSTTGVKPFSNTRDGLILGEGVGVLVLSTQQNSATIFEVLGGYSSCDDFSLTITDEEGEHITQVVEKALSNTNIRSIDIDLIKIHGTASEKSDLAEYNAIAGLFNTKKVKHTDAETLSVEVNVHPSIIGFKSFLGHTLGACGVLELAILEDVFQKEILPRCHYQLESPQTLLYPFLQSAKAITSSKYMLLNHFGFGGNNAAIILKNIKVVNPISSEFITEGNI